jgi:hypothetical protein
VTASLSGDTLNYPWRIEAGERERLSIPVLTEDGTPADLTGYTIDAVIRDRQGGVVIYEFPPEHVTVEVPEDPEEPSAIVLLIPAPISAAWTWTIGWWRLLITAPVVDPEDPDTHRIIQGPFTISLD